MLPEPKLYLRKISKQRWIDEPPWLPKGETPADCVSELKTVGNALSVYLVDSGEPESWTARVAAAIATGSESLRPVEFFYLSTELLERLSVNLVRTPGKTPDDAVNAWHFELQELTATKLAEIAREVRIIIGASEDSTVRLLKTAVEKELREALAERRFSVADLNEKLAKRLGED
jgi:hypothetical protein